MFKKILIVSLFLGFMNNSFAEYQTLDCNSSSIFLENSCTSCYDGGEQIEGNKLGFLSDVWVNNSDFDEILYTEEQSQPEMINLSSVNVVWSKKPELDSDFWETTKSFSELYSSEQDGYVLESNKTIIWRTSELLSSYNLEKNTEKQGENIGLLVYPLFVHNILSDGEITMDTIKTNKCILFKSAGKTDNNEDQPKFLPMTGPAEYILLFIIAILFTFFYFNVRTRI